MTKMFNVRAYVGARTQTALNPSPKPKDLRLKKIRLW